MRRRFSAVLFRIGAGIYQKKPNAIYQQLDLMNPDWLEL
jgi:hypothetical protein